MKETHNINSLLTLVKIVLASQSTKNNQTNHCQDLLTIGHVRYINILTWLRGFRDKLLYLALFSLYSSLFWELRDKRNLENLHFLPESLGAMLEY